MASSPAALGLAPFGTLFRQYTALERQILPLGPPLGGETLAAFREAAARLTSLRATLSLPGGVAEGFGRLLAGESPDTASLVATLGGMKGADRAVAYREMNKVPEGERQAVCDASYTAASAEGLPIVNVGPLWQRFSREIDQANSLEELDQVLEASGSALRMHHFFDATGNLNFADLASVDPALADTARLILLRMERVLHPRFLLEIPVETIAGVPFGDPGLFLWRQFTALRERLLPGVAAGEALTRLEAVALSLSEASNLETMVGFVQYAATVGFADATRVVEGLQALQTALNVEKDENWGTNAWGRYDAIPLDIPGLEQGLLRLMEESGLTVEGRKALEAAKARGAEEKAARAEPKRRAAEEAAAAAHAEQERRAAEEAARPLRSYETARVAIERVNLRRTYQDDFAALYGNLSSDQLTDYLDPWARLATNIPGLLTAHLEGLGVPFNPKSYAEARNKQEQERLLEAARRVVRGQEHVAEGFIAAALADIEAIKAAQRPFLIPESGEVVLYRGTNRPTLERLYGSKMEEAAGHLAALHQNVPEIETDDRNSLTLADLKGKLAPHFAKIEAGNFDAEIRTTQEEAERRAREAFRRVTGDERDHIIQVQVDNARAEAAKKILGEDLDKHVKRLRKAVTSRFHPDRALLHRHDFENTVNQHLGNVFEFLRDGAYDHWVKNKAERDAAAARQAVPVVCEGDPGSYVVTIHKSETPGEVVLGRKKGEVLAGYDSISRQHLRAVHDGTRWMVADAGSGNGTYLDGEELRTTPRTFRKRAVLNMGEAYFIMGVDTNGDLVLTEIRREDVEDRYRRPSHRTPKPPRREEEARPQARAPRTGSSVLKGDVDVDRVPVDSHPAADDLGSFAMATSQGIGYNANKPEGKRNEDGVAWAFDPEGNLCLLDVDGMGGQGDGEVATEKVIDAFTTHFPRTGDAKVSLRAGHDDLDVWNEVRRTKRGKASNAAAVAVAAHILQPTADQPHYRAKFYSSGDPEGWLLRKQSGKWQILHKIEQHKGRNKSGHWMPTAGLGMSDSAFQVAASDEIPLQEGDLVLLGSDCLTKVYGDDIAELLTLIQSCQTAEGVVQVITNDAHQRMKHGRKKDNFSVNAYLHNPVTPAAPGARSARPAGGGAPQPEAGGARPRPRPPGADGGAAAGGGQRPDAGARPERGKAAGGAQAAGGGNPTALEVTAGKRAVLFFCGARKIRLAKGKAIEFKPINIQGETEGMFEMAIPVESRQSPFGTITRNDDDTFTFKPTAPVTVYNAHGRQEFGAGDEVALHPGDKIEIEKYVITFNR